jgi:adenylate cyclase class 2
MSVKTPVETEVKIAAASAPAVRAKLRRAGFRIRATRVHEQNTVLDDSNGSLRSKGLLLRVRQAGKKVVCTYKGPESEGRYKSREEREFECSDYAEAVGLFAGIGYRQSFYYEKFRTEFERSGERGHITLDETPIGVFLELEGPSRWIDRTSKELGFAPESWITSSYAFLYSKWQAEMGGDPAAMRFRKKS